jgi:uncharacterized membrane protein YkoI
MKLKRILLIACIAGSLGTAGKLFAEDPATPAAEAKKTGISMDEARAIALAKVPGGELSAEELGRPGGKLTYLFDILIPGKKGLEIVSVLASDGTVVSVKHKSEWAARRDAQEKRRREAARPK